jgi:serine protease AprX
VRTARRRGATVLAVPLALALAVPAAGATRAAATTGAAGAPQRVVVQSTSPAAAAAAVTRAGGRVLRSLPIVDGVSAEVPAGARLDAVVTPDDRLHPMSTEGSPSGPPANVYREAMAATSLPAATRDPVTVALIDTGISPLGGLEDNLVRNVPDARRQGAVADCANFSSETTCDDSYGHGTFLAGLIAGEGPFPGIAPHARLLNVKIAGRDGAADTSQLLAAIQYVVSFKDQLGIGVLNLSLGTDSRHDYRKDPLNRAVEHAWQAGIVVVVSASNRGPSDGTISKPADDPLVVTVGAVDDRGTAARADDTVPDFTGRGPVKEGPPNDAVTVYKPDVVAPGVGLISLNVAHSRIDDAAGPSSVGVEGYRRGSGTSQSAAVVSGAVALLLERQDWSPDEVKAALYVGARHMDAPFKAVGAGLVNVRRSLDARVEGFRQPAPREDSFDGLDLTREGVKVTSFTCDALRAQLDSEGCTYVAGQLLAEGTTGDLGEARLLPFDAAAYADPLWYGHSWYGNSWYGSQWAQGNSWYGNSWYGNSWYGNSWYSTDAPQEGQQTPLGAIVRGSAWYGVWN